MNGTLDRHHIDTDKFNDDPENFITLSHSAHLKLHAALLKYYKWVYNIEHCDYYKSGRFRKWIISWWIKNKVIEFNHNPPSYLVPVIHNGIQRKLFMDGGEKDQFIGLERPENTLPDPIKTFCLEIPRHEFLAYIKEQQNMEACHPFVLAQLAAQNKIGE